MSFFPVYRLVIIFFYYGRFQVQVQVAKLHCTLLVLLNTQDRCREYAVITEPLNGLRLVVCGLNGFHRYQHVYTSRSNVVRLQMAAWPRRNSLSTSASGSDVTPARYVIHYEGNSLFCCITRLGGRVMHCSLSVRPSVCPSVPLGLIT